MSDTSPQSHSNRHDLVFAFVYVGALLVVGAGMHRCSQIPYDNARSRLQEIIGPAHVDAESGGINEKFAAAMRVRVQPMFSSYFESDRTIDIIGNDGVLRSVPVTITPTISNPSNSYYAFSGSNGHVDLVRCRSQFSARVQLDGLVAQELATITTVVKDCYPADASANANRVDHSDVSQFRTPKGLRYETAVAMIPMVRNGDFPITETRITLQLSSFGEATVMVPPPKERTTAIQLFINGKLLTCDTNPAVVREVKLPNRATIADRDADGRLMREFVKLRFCS
ncbi:MAG: hypothetical protein SFW65_03555 [Alphaproteobacteria bacterium]|nr:hypothetical protein [Alphaproteobacteria bacterium]